MQYGPEYWGTVIAARVQQIASTPDTIDDDLLPRCREVRVTAQLFTDDAGRFVPGAMVRVGAELPSFGGIRTGLFVIEESEVECSGNSVQPLVTVMMRSYGEVLFQDPLSGAVPPNPPAFRPVSPPPPPPPLPVARPRPQRRKPVRPADPPTYDAPGRRINLDE